MYLRTTSLIKIKNCIYIYFYTKQSSNYTMRSFLFSMRKLKIIDKVDYYVQIFKINI